MKHDELRHQMGYEKCEGCEDDKPPHSLLPWKLGRGNRPGTIVDANGNYVCEVAVEVGKVIVDGMNTNADLKEIFDHATSLLASRAIEIDELKRTIADLVKALEKIATCVCRPQSDDSCGFECVEVAKDALSSAGGGK